MNLSAIVKGVAVGAAVGTTCYLLTKASDRKKHSMKRHAGKALKAVGSVLDDFTSLVM